MKNFIFTLSLACFITGSLFAQLNTCDGNQHLKRSRFNVQEKSLLSHVIGKRNPIFNQPQAMYSDAIVKQRVDSLVIKIDTWNSGNYNNIQKSVYTYNNDQQVVSSLNMEWDGAWINSWKENFSYNTMNLPDSIIAMEWVSSNWRNLELHERNYNTNNSLKSEIIYFWNGLNQWELNSKYEYTYSNDSIVESIYVMDTDWRLVIYTTYQYTNGVLSSEITKHVYAEGGEENYERALYAYNNGELAQVLRSEWNGTGWEEPFGEYSYAYDLYNNLNYYAFSAWNDETSAWDLRDDSNLEYNNQYPRNELIIPFFFDELNFRHMLVSSLNNVYYFAPYSESYLTTLYYSPVIIQKAINPGTFTSAAYPNPANETITFSWSGTASTAQLSVYSATGMLINSNEIHKNTPVAVNELKSGIYIYTLRNKEIILGQGKFVVK